MAVNRRQPVQLHQMLHGYDDGHRFLAGSLKPDGKSAKTLLVLSDLSGQGLDSSSDGYLTGYPLREMGVYALARTWSAHEMPRPGCVWTHTILIDFADLADIQNPGILNLFHRPTDILDAEDFRNKIQFEEGSFGLISSDARTAPTMQPGPFGALVEAVYGYPEKRIFVEMPYDEVPDEAALVMWLQQWPKLRRSFRFCTWAPTDRSLPHEEFDLQFVPAGSQYPEGRRDRDKGYWVNLWNASAWPTDNWADKISFDALQPNRSDRFRKFLWRYGAEAETGRSAFKPLVEVWLAMEDIGGVNPFEAVGACNQIHPQIASLSKEITEQIILGGDRTKSISSSVARFLVRNLPFIDGQITSDYAKKIAEMVWSTEPDYIWPLFQANTKAERSVAHAAVSLMEPADFVKVATGNVDLVAPLLTANPEFASSPVLWKAPKPIPSRAAEAVMQGGWASKGVLSAMLSVNRVELANFGIEMFGQKAVDAAVKQYDGGDAAEQKSAVRWILAAKKFPKLLLRTLGRGKIRQMETLELLASILNQEPQPTLGKEPWVAALANIANGSSRSTINVLTFILARALSGESPESGVLFHYSFDPVHRSLIKSRGKGVDWSVLEAELPPVPLWPRQNRASTLCSGVVHTFIKKDLAPRDFLRITENEVIFKNMIDEAARTSAGRNYLEEISSWAKKSDDDNDSRLGRLIGARHWSPLRFRSRWLN